MTTASHVEVILPGGFTNAGLVSRVGDTVRRPQRKTSAATQALLLHLERVGFDGAPRFLGVDDKGREVLSYIPGEAAIHPQPDWVWSDEALDSVARLLRGYHAAVRNFDAAPHDWPPPVPSRFRDGLISHNDPNLDNVIFRDRRAVALIDFDLAGPGSSAWDLACCGRLWAPLRADQDLPGAVHRGALTRLRRFADGYGATDAERTTMVKAMVDAHDWCYSIVDRAVARGHKAFGLYWWNGGQPKAERTREYLDTHAAEMCAALGVG